MPALERLHIWNMVLSMLAFAVKYRTGCLYLNNCVHGLESFLYLKLYNTMILVNAGMGNTPLLHVVYGVVHAGIYWLSNVCMVIFHIGISIVPQ